MFLKFSNLLIVLEVRNSFIEAKRVLFLPLVRMLWRNRGGTIFFFHIHGFSSARTSSLSNLSMLHLRVRDYIHVHSGFSSTSYRRKFAINRNIQGKLKTSFFLFLYKNILLTKSNIFGFGFNLIYVFAVCAQKILGMLLKVWLCSMNISKLRICVSQFERWFYH